MGTPNKIENPFNPDAARRMHLQMMRNDISRAIAIGKVAGEDVSILLAQAARIGDKLKTIEED